MEELFRSAKLQKTIRNLLISEKITALVSDEKNSKGVSTLVSELQGPVFEAAGKYLKIGST
jgi:hypothetical protein